MTHQSHKEMQMAEPFNVTRVEENSFSVWIDLMRKFSDAHEIHCRSTPSQSKKASRSTETFVTGSLYHGTWDVMGMSGHGTYKFPHGVVYHGHFSDGMFHGTGEMRYQCGARLIGKWKKGVNIKRKLIFADGLKYTSKNWKYCQPQDRRFQTEFDKGLQPAGRSFLTNDQPTVEIPQGYYDTGDGFYHPQTKVVSDPLNLFSIVRAPSKEERKWIELNCRYSPDRPVGSCKDLFIKWAIPMAKYKLPASTFRTRNKSIDVFHYSDDSTDDDSLLDEAESTEDLFDVSESDEESSNDESFL